MNTAAEQLNAILANEGITASVRRIPTYANQVYAIGDDRILKIYDSQYEWENTVRMYAMLAEHAIPAPQLMGHGSQPSYYIILARLAGRPMSEHRTAASYRSLGGWVGRLHSITFDAFGSIGPAGIVAHHETGSGPFRTWKEMHMELIRHRLIGAETSPVAHLVPQILAFFASYPYPEFTPCLLHEDLNRTNIFTDGVEVTGVIDPDGGYAGCYEEELMRIEIGHFPDDDTLRDAFFEGYTERRRLDPGYEDRRPMFRLSRTCVEIRCLINLPTYKEDRRDAAWGEAIRIVEDILNHGRQHPSHTS